MKRWFQSKSINTPSPVGAALSYLVLGFWAFLILFPLYWLVITSFKISSQVAEGPFYIPFVDFKPSLAAWKYILVALFHPKPMDVYQVVAWLGWTLNLLVAEIIIIKKINYAVKAAH